MEDSNKGSNPDAAEDTAETVATIETTEPVEKTENWLRVVRTLSVVLIFVGTIAAFVVESSETGAIIMICTWGPAIPGFWISTLVSWWRRAGKVAGYIIGAVVLAIVALILAVAFTT